jgi:VCBS repeat-containing protein
VLAGSVSGVVFSDVNSDGVFQPAAGETALASRRVYIDANANGRFDSATEASAITAADGTYSLGNLAAANYRLVLEGSEDWEQTAPVAPSNMWVTHYDSLYEYTRSGQLVRILPVEAPPGGRRAGYFAMKDVTVDHSGRIHVLQGDYQLAYISTFDPSTGTWQHHTSPEFTSFYGNAEYGELSTEGDNLYIGLRRFNLLDWTSTSYTLPPFHSLSDVRMGLNGKLYGWNSGSPQYLAYEFDPATYVIQREIPLYDENNTRIHMVGLEVDAGGDIYAADINGRTYHYSPTGSLIGFRKLHDSYPTDLDLSTDGWLIAGHRFGDAGGMSVTFSPPQVFTVWSIGTFTAFTTYQGTGSSTLPQFVTLATNENKVQVDFGTHKVGPVATDDAYSLDEDVTLDVLAADGVLENDAGQQLSVTLLDDVQHGTLTLREDGSFNYAPTHEFNGLDSFSYQVTDNKGRTATGTVSLTINPVNDPPAASDDQYDVNANCSGYVLLVLKNDSVAPEAGETLEVTQVGTPSQGGTAAINADGTAILYEPAPGFFGEEKFTYVAGDGHGGTDTATVTVQVIHSWHSAWHAADVDGDFHVIPLDALLVINELNSVGSHLLAPPPDEYVYLLDVDGDGYVSPVDALRVINELNFGPPPSPEGEGPAAIVRAGGGWEGLVLLLAEDVAAQRKR